MSEDKRSSYHKNIIQNIDDSVDLIILLQGILSNAVTDITLSELNQGLTEKSQFYLNQVKRCYIDYSDIKQEEFKKQLELDSEMMLKAKINNNFEEYCRSACLQIEATLEHFCLYLCDQDKRLKYPIFLNKDNFWKNKDVDPNKFNKMIAYDFWFSDTYNIRDRSKYMNKNDYTDIICIMKIRDAASHRTLGNISFQEKINKVINNNNKLEKTKDFYEKRDFELVKKRTEYLVKNILLRENYTYLN